MDVAEVRRLKQLKGENAKLERLVADLSLDKAILQACSGRKSGFGPAPRARRQRPGRLASDGAPGMPRAVRFADDGSLCFDQAWTGGLRMRIKEIAAVCPSWGSLRIHALLRREVWLVNHKRTQRLYRLEGLNLSRIRPRRRKDVVTRGSLVAATRKDERWSMDFMHG